MAGCSNCGTDCDDITLPTGDDGAQGSTGISGGTILFSSAVNTSTASTSSEILYTYTMSNPSPLDEAGDELVIRSYWSTNDLTTVYGAGTTPPLVKIKIGGNDISPNNITTYPQLGNGVAMVYYEVRLTRITSTTAFVTTFITRTSSMFNVLGPATSAHSPNVNYSTAQTVPNLDSGAQTITFEADSVAIGDVTLDRVIIEKIEKV